MKFKELIAEAEYAPKKVVNNSYVDQIDGNLKVGDLVMYKGDFDSGKMSTQDMSVKDKYKEKTIYKLGDITKERWLQSIGKLTKLEVNSMGDLIGTMSGGKIISYGINGPGQYATMLVRVDKNGKPLKPKWVDKKDFTKEFLTDRQKADRKLMLKLGVNLPYPEKVKVPPFPNFKKASGDIRYSLHEKWLRLTDEYKLHKELSLTHPNSLLFITSTEYGDKSNKLGFYLGLDANKNLYADDIAKASKSSNKLLKYFFKNAVMTKRKGSDYLYLDLTVDKHMKAIQKFQTLGMFKTK